MYFLGHLGRGSSLETSPGGALGQEDQISEKMHEAGKEIPFCAHPKAITGARGSPGEAR